MVACGRCGKLPVLSLSQRAIFSEEATLTAPRPVRGSRRPRAYASGLAAALQSSGSNHFGQARTGMGFCGRYPQIPVDRGRPSIAALPFALPPNGGAGRELERRLAADKKPEFIRIE